jgi:hypothetical protein
MRLRLSIEPPKRLDQEMGCSLVSPVSSDGLAADTQIDNNDAMSWLR